ncbi:ABC transporter permease [Luteibacter aegosomatissinici]|uniref:ABC transporter permease n=1 Tax=Luteibacter aegosomatissinici TaxID=2911539 RepID=UPI001FFA5756|nr:ABC transporter permease [Luteibacter aegosomatissinici]UPG94675.1 ABC transporter permease [Luteibacter aegosomatissinici]
MNERTASVLRACRRLFQRPGHVVLGATTLALAVATFFATFTLIDALLLTPPAFGHHADVVLYGEVVRPASPRSLSMSLYDATGSPQGVLSRGLARSIERASVRSGPHAGLLTVQRVDPGFLPTLGVTPSAGTLALEAGGRDGVALSWRLWRAWFGGEPNLTGRTVVVDGRTLPIVGVLPPAYRLFDEVDLLLPLRLVPGASASVPNYLALARLAPDVSPDGLVAHLRSAAPPHGGGANRGRFGATYINDALTQVSAPGLWFFLACAVLVLATAAGNLANLMLARALARSRETALRRALGAGSWGTWAPAVIEAGVIGAVGLGAGMVLGYMLVRSGESYIPDGWRVNAGELPIGWRVYVATGIAALATTALAAIGGTLHEHGDALLRTRGAGGYPYNERVTARAIRVAMVQMQLALATVLLSLCVVRAMQVLRLEDVAPGFDATGAAAARFRLDSTHFDAVTLVAQAAWAIARQTTELPGVASAGVTTQLPTGTSFNVAFAGTDGKPMETQFALATPGARAAQGLHLLAGRDITSSDSADAPAVAVVNRAFLAAMPGAGLGTTIRKVSRSLGNRELRIVGVVADTRDAGPADAPRPWVTVPFAQLPGAEFAAYRSLLSYYVVVRGTSDAAAASMDLNPAVRAVAPWLVLERPQSLARAWHDSRAGMERDTWLATLFASLGLCLSLVGLYSAQRVEVASRHRDLALCAALGATPSDLLGMCFARGVARGAQGIGLGLAAAFAWSRWPPAALAPDAHFDMAAALVVAVAMLFMASAVALSPAWRSAATAPLYVMRDH